MIVRIGKPRKICNTHSELDVGREEVDALVGVQRALDESRCNNTLLAVQSAEQGVGELGTGISHGQGCTSCTILGLHDLVTTELNSVHERIVRLALDGLSVARLGEQGHDGRTTVSSNDGDGGI